MSLLVLCCYLFLQIVQINSRTSNLWKLNSDNTKIVEGGTFQKVLAYTERPNGMQFITEDDPIFQIITTTVHLGERWIKEPLEYYCIDCNIGKGNEAINQTVETDDSLTCGKSVNFTYYDNLVGVLNRNKHPNVPEHQTSLIFTKELKNRKGFKVFDLNSLEEKLRRVKKDKPKSIQLYNLIGNYWRLKGETKKAIECFRRALAVSPHNAELLHNLARVLFTLQYLDDAIYLTKRSLEVQTPEKGAWQQYFTLGEILKAYGHYQEAIIHFKHTLQLQPGFEPAQIALKELENNPTPSIHMYTLLIIICLVLGVLLVILSSVDNITDNDCLEVRPQRHFNKAMVMRSLRGLRIAQKHSRAKRLLA